MARAEASWAITWSARRNKSPLMLRANFAKKQRRKWCRRGCILANIIWLPCREMSPRHAICMTRGLDGVMWRCHSRCSHNVISPAVLKGILINVMRLTIASIASQIRISPLNKAIIKRDALIRWHYAFIIEGRFRHFGTGKRHRELALLCYAAHGAESWLPATPHASRLIICNMLCALLTIAPGLISIIKSSASSFNAKVYYIYDGNEIKPVMIYFMRIAYLILLVWD